MNIEGLLDLISENQRKMILALISENQRKMILALIEHPEGLLSRELARMTAVSNKSATMTPDLRRLLEEHGLELIIERGKGGSRWAIRNTEQQEPVRTIPEADIERAKLALEEAARICQDVKQLLG